MKTFIVFALLSIFAVSAFSKATVSIPQRIALIQASKGKQEKIDQVLKLLQELADSTQNTFDNVNNAWSIRQPELEGLVALALGNVNDKTERCTSIQNEVDSLNAQIEQTNTAVANAENVIEVNTATINKRQEQRCQENLLFINRKKENLQAVKLLEFIRTVLSTNDFRAHLETQRELLQLGEKNDFAFLQTAVRSKNPYEIFSGLHIFLQHKSAIKQDEYTGTDNLDDVLAVRERSAEDIGTGHVDNAKDALTDKTFTHDNWSTDDLVYYAVSAVNFLIQALVESDQILTERELISVSNLILFIGAAEDEIEKQQVFIVQLKKHLENLEAALVQNIEAHDVCIVELTQLQGVYDDAVELLDQETETYKAKVVTLQDDVALFGEAIRLYTQFVQGAAVEYQKRVDDFADNANFDSTSFEARGSVDSIADFGANVNSRFA